MKKKLIFLFATTIVSVCMQAQSFTAGYAFDSVKTTSGIIDSTPVPTATGLTFGSFSAAGVSTNPTATARFSFKTWSLGATTGNDVYANLIGTLNTSQYYEVTVSPDLGYKLSLTGIKFKMFRSGTGIRTYSVRSSVDGYTANLPASISPANTKLSVQTDNVFFWNLDSTTTTQSGSTITLGGMGFTDIVSPVTFRFYAWNAEGTAGTFSIDNDTIFGSAAHIVTANFSADTACFGASTHFTDLSTSIAGSIATWTWDFGDGSLASHAQDPTHLYTTAGTKNVTLIAEDNVSNKDTISQTVFVDSVRASLTKNITGNVVTFTGSGSNGIAPYQTVLNFGDGSSSPNPNSTHTYTASGPYTACLTVTDSVGCSDSSCVSFTIIGTGINSSVSGGISIYPNPSENGVFTVNTGSYSGKTTVTVYNIIGEVIVLSPLNSLLSIIDLSAQPNGSYFVNIKNDASTITRKITVNK